MGTSMGFPGPSDEGPGGTIGVPIQGVRGAGKLTGNTLGDTYFLPKAPKQANGLQQLSGRTCDIFPFCRV